METQQTNGWQQYFDTNSQMLNILDHLGGNVLHDANRITLPELEAKLKQLNTNKASGHDRISNKTSPTSSLLLPLSSIPCTTFLSTPVIILWFGNEPWAWWFLNQIRRNRTLAVFDPYLSFAGPRHFSSPQNCNNLWMTLQCMPINGE